MPFPLNIFVLHGKHANTMGFNSSHAEVVHRKLKGSDGFSQFPSDYHEILNAGGKKNL